MTDVAVALTRAETIALADCETRIEHGMKTYVEVGMALGAIRENKLYRAEHETFEAYCAARWNFTGRRGRQLIEAAEIGNMFPVENSRQAAELAAVPEANRADVLAEATERTNGKPTAAAIRKAAEAHTQSPGPTDAAHSPPADPGAAPAPVSDDPVSQREPDQTPGPAAAPSTAPDGPGSGEEAAPREGGAASKPEPKPPADPTLDAQLAQDSTRRAAIRNLTSVLTYLVPVSISPERLVKQEYAPVLDAFEQRDLDLAAETMTALAAMKRGM